MKIRLALLLAATLVCLLPAAGQTLADRARELRKEKRTQSANEKVFTNESLNLRPGPSISDKPTDKSDAKKAESEGEEGDEKEVTPDEQKAQMAADYRDKISKAKEELATLQRELDIAERENKLRIAQFYADAGNRLRNEKQFTADQQKTLADIADKQKRIGETQATLEKLRAEARRAGIPPGMVP